MQKLIDLINNEEYVQAKQFIIDNRGRIDDVADCLLGVIKDKTTIYYDSPVYDGVDHLPHIGRSREFFEDLLIQYNFDEYATKSGTITWIDDSADPASDIDYLRGHVKRCIEDIRNSRKESLASGINGIMETPPLDHIINWSGIGADFDKLPEEKQTPDWGKCLEQKKENFARRVSARLMEICHCYYQIAYNLNTGTSDTVTFYIGGVEQQFKFEENLAENQDYILESAKKLIEHAKNP